MPGARSRLVIALALVVGLAWPGGAQGAITGVPQFTLSPFTKATGLGGGLAYPALTWLPPAFAPPTPADKQVVVWADLDGGPPVIVTVGPTTSSISPPIAPILHNGHRYSITVLACQTDTCAGDSPQTTGTTRLDATPPSGTMQIKAGAVWTNDRNVTLNLAATDPLIGGVPGTSSGVTESATDIDGDGITPCDPFATPPSSGCAAPFAPTVPATLDAGDGVKTVGVRFGDGARDNTPPCATIFCTLPLGGIQGNASALATDTILLDTVKPVAIATQDRFTVDRGGAVGFDATSSLDTGGAAASGVDPATATWAFKDGTPSAKGAKVAHVFTRTGTFVGELRVRDRAGNLSNARAFSVTVDPGPGAAATGGSLGGVTGSAAFQIDRLKVRARYVRSRLSGSIALHGSSTRPGALRAEFRRRAGGPLLAKAAVRRLLAGPFARTVRLPARLVPGTYRVAFVGPGGTLGTTLTLRAPREGVMRSGRMSLSGGRAVALFGMAAQPVRSLRGRLVVSWSQGRRRLGSVPVTAGALIRATLPAGAAVSAGRLRAELRAGRTVVGSVATQVR
jgi:hypothetical protein